MKSHSERATSRLTLRPFRRTDLDAFAMLHADPASMADLGGPISRNEAARKLNRYLEGQLRDGISRLHVSDPAGFVGYVGVCCHPAEHPLGAHAEIGWRLLPRTWGLGYATEAARAALPQAFAATRLRTILAYTAAENTRSQAVMARLGLKRQPDLDFAEPDPVLGTWHGLVWVARAKDWPLKAG